MKQIKFFLEGESPTLMTSIDSTKDQNIVIIERVNIPSYIIFPWVMQACKFTKIGIPP